MVIEVKKLNAVKKYEGDFEFEYEAPQGSTLIPLCNIEGKVKVSGSYEIYEDDCVGVSLTVDYNLVGQCSYCLNDAKQHITYTTDVLYVPEKDDDNYYYDGIKINLKTAVDEAILISQPNVLLCKEGCEGIDITNK